MHPCEVQLREEPAALSGLYSGQGALPSKIRGSQHHRVKSTVRIWRRLPAIPLQVAPSLPVKAFRLACAKGHIDRAILANTTSSDLDGSTPGDYAFLSDCKSAWRFCWFPASPVLHSLQQGLA